MTHAYDFIDKAVLPDEYLPDDYTGPSAGPQKQIIGTGLPCKSDSDVMFSLQKYWV